MLGRNREVPEQHGEHKDVVDREAVFDEVAGEIFAARLGAARRQHEHSKAESQRDPERDPTERGRHAHRPSTPLNEEQVNGEEDADNHAKHGPQRKIGHDGLRQLGRRSFPPHQRAVGPGAPRTRLWRSVLTTLPRGDTPLRNYAGSLDQVEMSAAFSLATHSTRASHGAYTRRRADAEGCPVTSPRDRRPSSRRHHRLLVRGEVRAAFGGTHPRDDTRVPVWDCHVRGHTCLLERRAGAALPAEGTATLQAHGQLGQGPADEAADAARGAGRPDR